LALCATLIPFNKVGHGNNFLVVDAPFDSYGNICWDEERARLDNFAIHLQQNPELVGYVIVYAGRHSCAGEAKARAERAKKWVVKKRGVEANRVILRDGGFREDVITILQPMLRNEAEYSIVPTLKPSDAQVIVNCKVYDQKKCNEL
jgi:hypothetical protein